MQLKPLPGYALVKLKQKYESGLSTEKEKYAERSEGTLVDFIIQVTPENELGISELIEHYQNYRGQEVYFAPYTEGEPVKHDGAEYVFLPIKELRGVKINA